MASRIRHERAGDRSSASGVEFYQLVQSADFAARQNDYQRSADLLERALSLSKQDPVVYAKLGTAYLALKRYGEAATFFQAARADGFMEEASSAVKIAACYALSGDRKRALEWLDEALKSRLKDRSDLAQDDRFASLRNDTHFKAIIGALPSRITNRVDGWSYDLDYLVDEIHRLDPAFPKALPAEFVARMALLRKNLTQLDDKEVALEVMALLASLKQGHTIMAPFGMRKGVLGLIPVQLYKFSDGLFVIDAPASNAQLVGGQVLKIGGVDVETLWQRTFPYVSRDNDQFLKFAVPIALSWPDLLKKIGAVVSSDSVEFDVRKSGQVVSSRIAIVSPIDPDKLPMKLIAPRALPSEPPLYLSHLDKNYWFNRISEESIYVQVNQFVDAQGRTLDGFADDLDLELKKHGNTRSLILDVRLNNGGDFSETFKLLTVLLSFEESRSDARLFVIEGRNTLSAAQNFISALDEYGSPIFVGEPSGSRPNHVGDDTTVILPYSGILGSIACAFHQTEFRDVRKWIPPAVPVELSSEDYFSQRDAALEQVLSFIASRQ